MFSPCVLFSFIMELFQVLSVPHRKIIFEDSCYLRAFVKSSKWTLSWKSSCWFDCYCNITVLLGLKAANGFWISLLFLPLSCYNVSAFEILGSTRALACVGTDVPPLSSLALLLIFSVGGGTFVHGSLVSTRFSFPVTRWTEAVSYTHLTLPTKRIV